MKNIAVSVGISAYNEEKNISNVLKEIISQKQNGWVLREVLMYSDGSSDKTAQMARTVKNPKIKIIDDGKRLGKTARIQQLFDNAKGEIIVMFDADIRIQNNDTITNLVKAFFKSKKIVLVGGNTIPFPPKNFFQRAVYSTFKVFYLSRISIRQGSNLFACTGACIAITQNFARIIKLPKIKNQDTYLYFLCKAKGFEFEFVPEAVVFYKLPNTLPDYLAQVFRSNPEAVELNLTEYFGDLIRNEYDRGRMFYLKSILKVFLTDPLPTLYIIIINFACRPLFRFISKTNRPTWDAVSSTK